MATSGVIISEMAKVSGDLPSTIDRMLRSLRAAGLAPMGAPGRGKQEGQFNLDHLADLVISFAGRQPSDAAEAVLALCKLKDKHEISLHERVKELILQAAESIQEKADWEPADITLSSNYFTATIRRYRNGHWELSPFVDYRNNTMKGYISRSVAINEQVIRKAAALWLDFKQQSMSLSQQADTKTTKAGEAPTSSDPRASSKQAAKPASAITEQPSDTHTKGQSRRGGLSSSSPSEKG